MTKVALSDATHANQYGYSDVAPYEIVRKISDKTIEIRAMDATKAEDSPKLDFHVGGFAAHCTNQSKQKWTFSSAPESKTIRARLRKDGYFHSAHGRHVLSTKPHKRRDYNF